MRVLFLDIDGVLNRERYRPTESFGLRSWIEPELAQRLCEVLQTIKAEIVLSSDWRRGRELALLRDELRAAGIDGTMIDVTREIHGPRWRMLIIGASEIARYLAEVAATLDFQVFVCDPREEYHTAWRVAGSTFVDGMPDDAVMAFKPDRHTVIVTVSHDPKLDDMALMEALKTDAFYIGAVGSQKTSDERRKRLRDTPDFGLTDGHVAKLHGPVGLAIGSRTPPEIAIAILAELVAARNGVVLARSRSAAGALVA